MPGLWFVGGTQGAEMLVNHHSETVVALVDMPRNAEKPQCKLFNEQRRKPSVDW